MKIFVRPLLAGALLSGVLYNAVPAQSQTEPAPLQTRKVYEIPLQNVSAHLLAYWLDPTHQLTPPELGLPDHEKIAPSPHPANANAKSSPFDLPVGIDKIVADDTGKKLLVFGEEAAVQKLRDVVAFLDRPLRQVELETHIVFMKPEDFQAFGLDFGRPPGAPQRNTTAQPLTAVGFVGPTTNWLPLLTERTRTGQMSELGGQKVTLYNNLSGSVEITHSRPLSYDLQYQLGALVPQSAVDTPLELQTPLKIALTPTINNDDSITVLLNLKGQVQLAHQGSPDVLPLSKPSGITSIANIRDGDTIAMSGFDTHFTSAFVGPTTPQNVPMLGVNSKKALPGEMVVFLTARILHH